MIISWKIIYYHLNKIQDKVRNNIIKQSNIKKQKMKLKIK